MSKHILKTTAQGSPDATSTPQSSHEPGSEEDARKALDDLQAALIARPGVDGPSDWLPWDVT